MNIQKLLETSLQSGDFIEINLSPFQSASIHMESDCDDCSDDCFVHNCYTKNDCDCNCDFG